jgi:enoyl-CoA hydratase/carnithine racemase
MMTFEPIGSGVWQIELQRPTKRNALTCEAYIALADHLKRAAGNPAVRAIVLSSQGEIFCAGNDLSEFATHWPQPSAGPVVQFLEALHRLPIPIVAAVQGAAVGIGATMLLHCDIIVGAPGAFLQFPFVDRRITAEGASSLLLPQRIGMARAMDLLLTGRRVFADEALSLGLISRIVRDQPPVAAAIEIAHSIAGKDVDAVAATKRLTRLGASESILPRFEEEIVAINALIVAARTNVV